MAYELEFVEAALKEWKKLAPVVREQFKKKLAERLNNPHVVNAKLAGSLHGLYKIKLRSLGYRLVYEVQDDVLVVLVLGVGRRNKDKIYQQIANRLRER